MDSFLENMGDVYKMMQRSTTDDCSFIQLEISKYFHRAMDALLQINYPMTGLKAILRVSGTFLSFRGRNISDAQTPRCQSVCRANIHTEFDKLKGLLDMSECDFGILSNKLLQIVVDVMAWNCRLASTSTK